jgi:dihydroneopterin aldolase
MAADKILIAALDCATHIGVTAEERQDSQSLSIDIEFSTDTRRAAATDSIRDAVDYAEVARVVAEICSGREFHLVETVAERIAEGILKGFPIAEVRVLVRKISPIAEPRTDYVSVEIIRP